MKSNVFDDNMRKITHLQQPLSFNLNNPLTRRILKIVLASLFLLILYPFTSSQAQPPSPSLLGAPLIATTNASEDGFIIYDLSSGEQRELSFGTGIQNFWGFSPNGCQILFTRETSPENFDLFIADLDGENTRKIVDINRGGALNYRIWEPTWSPDGEHIAFTIFRYFDPPNDYPYRESRVAWVSPDGGEPIFYSVTGAEYQPRWSSDGAFLVYVSEQPDEEESDEAITDPAPESTETPLPPPYYGSDNVPLPLTKAELWIISADGSDKQQFASFEEGALFNPRWSPDDQSIAFIYEPIPTTHRLMMLSVDHSTTSRSFHRSLVTILDFTWQPNGDGVTASIQGLNEIPENILWELNTDLATDEDAAPTINTDLHYLDFPRYSPDGTLLAFRHAYELTIYDPRDESLQSFGDESRNNSPPFWSPSTFQSESSCP